MTCTRCGRPFTADARFCSHCGTLLPATTDTPAAAASRHNDLNLPILYGMAVVLALAVLCPPWEAPPDDPPAFLGLHPFWMPPTATAVVSRMLLTIETMTIAIAGLYAAWFFRK